MTDNTTTVRYSGRYLKLVERDGWEFATRHNPTVVVIVAWTPDDELLLVEQFRKPVGRCVIELPAGLVGDLEEHRRESAIDAAHRELVEETGYAAAGFRELMHCPTSAGMTDETAVFLAAQEIRRVGEGGGDGSEDIVCHAVAAERIDAWLRRRYAAGTPIDPKIYTALYWSRRS